ncbi:TSCPD domain-containing protein [Clostridium intestinale]|uniref:TSCPD domain-containing protein n=1 Tax=Clostridium intestinale TaxID=36845 RepID=A0A7D6ZH92_9CLOT|nr:TSCPD domain-containing protein [Clostridium intestinale]
MIKGRPINEVADLLEGISCNGRVTSFFDPISKDLKDIFLQNEY